MIPASALPIEEGEAKRQFFEFYNEVMSVQLMDLAQSYPDTRSLKVDFSELSRFSPDLADAVVELPDVYLPLSVEALVETGALQTERKGFEPHVRIFNLPEESAITIQNIGAEHLNKMVRIDGVVTLIRLDWPLGNRDAGNFKNLASPAFSSP